MPYFSSRLRPRVRFLKTTFPHGKTQMDTKNLDPTIWGATFWFFFHLLSLGYPDHPNAITKKKYYDFIQNIPVFLPVDEISNHFAQLLDMYPVTPYLDSQESLVKWMVFIHNQINKKLEKREISLEEFYQLYKEKLRPVAEKHWEKQKKIEKYLFLLLCIGCIGVCFWMMR